jgi:hypothetical protein
MLLSNGGRLMRCTLTVLAVLWASGAPGERAIAAGSYSEDAVEAEFLYRFTGYVDWPPEALTDPQFTIAVLNADGVAAELEQLLQNRQVRDRPVQVRSIKTIRELSGAPMLYIGPAHRDELRHVISATAGRPVLIVTNEADGLDAGSMVNFVLIDQRVRFEISLDAAHSAGLKIASELLAVAVRVRGRRASSEAGCDEGGTPAYFASCTRQAMLP